MSKQRGWTTGIFFISILLGVVIGPSADGVLTYNFCFCQYLHHASWLFI